jgi:hypothetical protein
MERFVGYRADPPNDRRRGFAAASLVLPPPPSRRDCAWPALSQLRDVRASALDPPWNDDGNTTAHFIIVKRLSILSG